MTIANIQTKDNLLLMTNESGETYILENRRKPSISAVVELIRGRSLRLLTSDGSIAWVRAAMLTDIADRELKDSWVHNLSRDANRGMARKVFTYLWARGRYKVLTGDVKRLMRAEDRFLHNYSRGIQRWYRKRPFKQFLPTRRVHVGKGKMLRLSYAWNTPVSQLERDLCEQTAQEVRILGFSYGQGDYWRPMSGDAMWQLKDTFAIEVDGARIRVQRHPIGRLPSAAGSGKMEDID